MDVSEAVASRRSKRAYVDRPVAPELLREVLTLAARAPSGGNLQPWRVHVLTGETLVRFRGVMAARLARGDTDAIEYAVYPPSLQEPYRSQRFVLGEALYEKIGVARTDKLGRLAQFARNWDFFGAPAGLFCFVDRRMGPPQWSDLGMYLQTVMLLLRERGVDSCAQESWTTYAQTVYGFLQTAPEWMLFSGMAIGYADPDAPINALVSERADFDTFATLHT